MIKKIWIGLSKSLILKLLYYFAVNYYISVKHVRHDNNVPYLIQIILGVGKRVYQHYNCAKKS